MLRSIAEVRGYDIVARDGPVGDVHDLYFDDRCWSVRYLVVDTGRWLPGRKVLVKPDAALAPDIVSRSVPLKLTRREVADRPSGSVEDPAGGKCCPMRSMRKMRDLQIVATDGAIGHVDDLLFDDGSWVIRYVVIDTANWLTGRKVLVAPAWTRCIDWPEGRMHLGLDRRSVRASPRYDPAEPMEGD